MVIVTNDLYRLVLCEGGLEDLASVDHDLVRESGLDLLCWCAASRLALCPVDSVGMSGRLGLCQAIAHERMCICPRRRMRATSSPCATGLGVGRAAPSPHHGEGRHAECTKRCCARFAQAALHFGQGKCPRMRHRRARPMAHEVFRRMHALHMRIVRERLCVRLQLNPHAFWGCRAEAGRASECAPALASPGRSHLAPLRRASNVSAYNMSSMPSAVYLLSSDAVRSMLAACRRDDPRTLVRDPSAACRQAPWLLMPPPAQNRAT